MKRFLEVALILFLEKFLVDLTLGKFLEEVLFDRFMSFLKEVLLDRLVTFLEDALLDRFALIKLLERFLADLLLD